MTPGELSAHLYGNITTVRERPSAAELVDELRRTLEISEIKEVPQRGCINAGRPFPQEEQDLGNVPVPAHLLRGVKRVADVYALKVCGDSLIGDGILDSGSAVVDPNADFVDGAIYAVRLHGEYLARHVHRENGSVVLISSNGKYEKLQAEEVEILGRIIASGMWRKH